MKEINTSDFEKEVINGNKVVLDFYSTECPPCEALAPKFESLSKVYGNEIKFLKIFRQNNRELANKLNVSSSPTLLFFDNGKEVANRLTGGIKRSEIISNLNSMLSENIVKNLSKDIVPIVSEYDVIILGAGPAGLTAGLYLCQSKINTVVVDIALPGGNVSTTHEVSNYPGFIEPLAGYMLSHNMSEQTKTCGTKYKVAVDVSKVDLIKKEIVVDEYETIKAKKIIIATGTSPNKMGIPGETEFKGKGLSYCAICDAKYYVNKDVVVIGGGNSAVEEAVFISKFAKSIRIIHQFDKLTANQKAQEKIFANNKIDVLFEHEPRKIEKVENKFLVETENLKTKEIIKINTDGIFVFIGMKPNTEILNTELSCDKFGFILTDEDMRTSIPDVFAIGDIRSKKYRQITTAVADGTIAAIAISKELS